MKANGSILAVAALALAAFAAEARAQPYGTVSWDTGSPTTGVGSISGSGTYTVTTGWLPLNASIVVVPGLGGVVVITPGANPVGGIWGPIKATGLAPGGYAIYVVITFKDGLGHQDIVCSPVNFLTVVAGPAVGPVPGTVQGAFTPGKGTVSASGTYTTNTGWTAKASGLNAIPWEEAKFPRQVSAPRLPAASGEKLR